MRVECTNAQRLARRVACVFGCALLVGLAATFWVWPTQGAVNAQRDPYWFEQMARSLLRGEGFLPFGNLIHRRAPMYPLFIAGIYAVFGVCPVAVQIAQALLFAGTAALTFDLGRRLFGTRAGLVAGLLCGVHPVLLRYVPDFHLETLFTFLATLSIWLSYRFGERPTVRRGAALGAAIGVASLTKSVLVAYPVLYLLLLWWFRRKTTSRASGRGLVVPAVAVFVTMVVVISPWTYRNFRATGHFVPISSGLSDAFLRGFVFSKTDYILLRRPPYTDAENECNAWFRRLAQQSGTVWERDDYETDQILNREAKRFLLAHPVAFVQKTVVGLLTFWYEMTSRGNSLVAGVPALIAWILAIPGLRRARRDGKPAWIVLAPILYLNVSLALLLALGRYSVPVWPCLLVLAAGGVDELLEHRASKESIAA